MAPPESLARLGAHGTVAACAAALVGLLLRALPARGEEPATPPVAATTTAAEASSAAAASGAPAKARAEAEPAPSEERWIEGIDLGLHLGFGARLDAPAALELEAPVGLLAGAGLDVAVSPAFSVGLHYEHLDLGREAGAPGSTTLVRVSRELNDLWLGLRAFPLRNDTIGGFLAIGIGAVWQSVDASGVVWPAGLPAQAQSYLCSSSDSIAVALRAQLGIDVALVDAVRWWVAGGFDSYRLGDDTLEGCAPGAGNASVLGAQSGIVYRFDPEL